ncbi:MAG: acyloxyacyl hydrolase [Acidobacteriales bacterium]|nr:acyloxyacyl hydrolase [Terriglobales bacterium]
MKARLALNGLWLVCLAAGVYAADAPANVALAVTPVTTQSAAGSTSPSRHEFSMWGGFSPYSSHFIGAAVERKLSTLGLRYSRSLKSTRWASFKYTFDAVPVAFIRQPISHGVWEDRTRRESRFGAGLSPLGAQINLRPRSRVQPFAEGNVGFLYFTRPTPYTNSSNFNFTFSLGAGLQTFTSRRRAVSFGYKYHHLSNAFIAPANPGLDSNVFYVGYSLFR